MSELVSVYLQQNKKMRHTKYAFTFVEILIVVAILGILAAMVLPTLQGHIQRAKESAAKDNLRILRNTIEVYAARHNGVPPGYANNDPSKSPSHLTLTNQLVKVGKMLPSLPKNPFNEKALMNMIDNDEDFPAEPLQTDLYGWIYKPATKTVKLNWSGTDPEGISYFDY